MTAGRRTQLPAAARARLARLSPDGLRTSFLSAGSAASLEAVGFDPVGEVMGGTVDVISDLQVGTCKRSRVRSGAGAVSLGGASWGTNSVSYAARVSNGYARMLDRLRAEATAAGADGVVDVRITRTRAEEVTELVALGTAVRARSRTRPAGLFCTDLSGSDVAALLLRGWVPVDLVVAVQVGVHHLDGNTANLLAPARRNGPANQPVDALTVTRQKVTDSVVGKFRTEVARRGADGALLGSLDTASWGRECVTGFSSQDHVVRAVVVGTAITRFASRPVAPAEGLSILPLTTGGTR
jgi:hypothetical protein